MMSTPPSGPGGDCVQFQPLADSKAATRVVSSCPVNLSAIFFSI